MNYGVNKIPMGKKMLFIVLGFLIAIASIFGFKAWKKHQDEKKSQD